MKKKRTLRTPLAVESAGLGLSTKRIQARVPSPSIRLRRTFALPFWRFPPICAVLPHFLPHFLQYFRPFR